MDSKEFKQEYKKILSSIKRIDDAKYNTDALNDARKAIAANAKKIKECNRIIENNNGIIENTEQIIRGWNGEYKDFEKFLEQQNVFIRDAESGIETAKQAIVEAEQNIKELTGYIDEWNKEDSEKRKKAKGEKARLNSQLRKVRSNATKSYEETLIAYKKEYDDIKAQKETEKENLRRENNKIIDALSNGTNVAQRKAEILKSIKDQETEIDKKYLGILKEKNKQIIELEAEYKDLVSSFDKMDKNPDIEDQEIGLFIKPQAKQKPEEPEEVKPEEVKPEETKPEEKQLAPEQSAEDQPVKGQPAVRQPVTGQPTPVQLQEIDKIKVTSDGKYFVKYNNKEVFIEYEEENFWSRLANRINLMRKDTRDYFGISFKTAMRADVNIMGILLDRAYKNNSEFGEKQFEKYLKYLEDPNNNNCFELEYVDKENKFAKRFAKVQEKKKLKSNNREEVTRSEGREVSPRAQVNESAALENIQTPRPAQREHHNDGQEL